MLVLVFDGLVELDIFTEVLCKKVRSCERKLVAELGEKGVDLRPTLMVGVGVVGVDEIGGLKNPVRFKQANDELAMF